jgi:hypothetical protein
MTERRLLVADVETSGLLPHDICVEVAWHDVESGEHGSFVPAHDVAWVLEHAHPRALEVNGYRDRLVDAAQDDGTEVRRLHERLTRHVLAGSNVRTDAEHLARLFDAAGLAPREPWHYHLVELSSVVATAFGCPLTEPPGLWACCDLLGVDPEDTVHAAAGGAGATARCFRALIDNGLVFAS